MRIEPNRRIRLVSPATIAGAIQFDMRSRGNGRTYRIYVYEPAHECPPAGYPVIYITDGNALFCTAAMQAEMMEESALIVGIGYATADRREPDILRFRDLTWDAPPPGIRADFTTYLESDDISYGGAEAYFRFIKEEVEPALAEAYDIDRANRTIFGTSLGGLFTLHLLLKHPAQFRTYVAGSPSIWWNDRAILREVASFRERVESHEVAPRIMITVGSLEQSTEGLRIPKGMNRQRFEQMIRGARLIDNARELATELALIQGGQGYRVVHHVFDGETHQSVIATSISRAIRFSRHDMNMT